MLYINPVYQRELKQNSRMKKMVVLLVGFNTLLTLFGLLAFYLTFEAASNSGKAVRYSDMLTIYGIITGIEYILILFITPGISAGTIAGEREKQTLDIMLSSKLTPLQIINGKLMASISLMILLAFSSLPILGIVFSVGGITISELAQFMLLLIVTAIFIGSIGIFFSSLCKRSTIATVCTYTVLLVITIGLTMLLLGGQIIEMFTDAKRTLYYVNRTKSEVGDSVLLLIINPLSSFFAMLKNQIGLSVGVLGNWKTEHQFTYYVYQHWFSISLAVQFSIALILQLISARIIQPRRHK